MFPGMYTISAPGATTSPKAARNATKRATGSGRGGVFWRGADGKVYVKGHQGVNSAGNWDANTASYWASQGFSQIADPNAPAKKTTTNPTNPTDPYNPYNTYGTGGGSAPVLDQAAIDSLLAELGIFDKEREDAKRRAKLDRDRLKREKAAERKKEEGKYKGEKLSTLQEFGSARNETDLNTRDTLTNLLSSLSTMGLGGQNELTRQILAAANISNRQANATQAQNNQKLDTAWNEYTTGYDNDLTKIDDQYNYAVGEADKNWAKGVKDINYKVAGQYKAADDMAGYEKYMNKGKGMNDIISNSSFLNPKYTGEVKQMATPELSDYTQDIAQYTTQIGAPGADGTPTPGNLAVRAIAVNDQDLGVKKKTEGDLTYGV